MDFSISELTNFIRGIVGYEGRIELDPNRPDGTPRKLLDTTRLASLGWQPFIALQSDIREMYRWYREREKNGYEDVELLFQR